MSKSVLLAVLAHPDDESFGMGGTLALYASRGVDVHLVCATRGEAGEVSPEQLRGFSSKADLRESELRCASHILGLKSVHFLDYRDSGMPGSADNHHPRALAAQPVDEVAERIVRIIRELVPQVVLTFDPIGGYRHPDHIAVHHATLFAFEQAGNPVFVPDCLPVHTPGSLYYHIMPHGFLKIIITILKLRGRDPHKFGINGDIDLPSIAAVNFPIHARINIRPVQKIKEKAGACHASQGGKRMGGRLIGPLFRWLTGVENYMRASPPVERNDKISPDLFNLSLQRERTP